MKAILFDLDDTLIAWKEPYARVLGLLVSQLLEKYPEIDLEEIHLVLEQAASEYGLLVVKGERKRESLGLDIARRLNILGVSLDEGLTFYDKYLELIEKEVHAYPDTDILRELDGYLLGVVTNGQCSFQKEKLRKCELLKHFSLVVCSSDVGVKKPDTGIFEYALRMLDMQAGSVVMVGNSLESDVLGARAAGIRGILLDREGCKDYGDRIETLRELPLLLGAG